MTLLDNLGIHGWPEHDETLILASLLTGDPLLLIGKHGSAKTLLPGKIAEALGKRFLGYDASKAMFEDVLGYPDIEKMKHGKIEYVPSAVTIWDKELVLIDELNRALPELQSKWLEIIRSRKIMGFPTNVKWVWAAMNPMSYSATQVLDEALIGRFAMFLYPPDALTMSEEDRIRVLMHINGDDAPALKEWTDDDNGKTVPKQDISFTGERIRAILTSAAKHFHHLKESLPSLAEFLAKFADLLMRETNGEITLDGRRLGFMHRNLLAVRAVELAKAEITGDDAPDFPASARYVVQSSIPVGLNDESLKREEAVHKMEVCFDLLSAYFQEGSEIERVNRIYELFTTEDLMRKAEILLAGNVGEFAASKAWNDLTSNGNDITLLAYVALQVEARRPGTVPLELLESLSQKVDPQRLSTATIPDLRGDSIEHIEEVEALMDQGSDLGRIVAYSHVRHLAKRDHIRPEDIEVTRASIEADIASFERLLGDGGAS